MYACSMRSAKRRAVFLSLLLVISAPAWADDIERLIPGVAVLPPQAMPDINPDAVPPPAASDPRVSVPIPDRWRLVEAIGVHERRFDPYNQNTLKADRPLFDDWFLNLSLISDTVFEPRKFPVPVSPASGRQPGALDVFGGGRQNVFNQNLILGMVMYKGDTVFKPPEYEFRFTPVINYNRVTVEEDRLLNADPTRGQTRNDQHIGIQELFVDKHLRDVSDSYDFDSLRFGVQPFNADFRGFLFQDQAFGLRFFGNRDSNRYQYNLAWFRRIEKDTNSGLNDLGKKMRDDEVFIANLYRQDFPLTGFTSQAVFIYNRNRENTSSFYDNNGVLVRPASIGTERPRQYDVSYLGYNGDGHIGPLNLTASTYAVLGRETPGVFVNKSSEIRAWFAAAEASRDFDWLRLRASALYGSGDDNPYDRVSKGFDAIQENPIFAGADTSFWIRQSLPNIGGGGVGLSGRNGILNSLRSSKDQGQSNFTNPGIVLLGAGADMDVLPELRVSANLNHLFFAETAVLEVTRAQAHIDNEIGWDASVSLIYRPLMSQNVIIRLSGAELLPGTGFKQLYGDEKVYSVLFNVILTY